MPQYTEILINLPTLLSQYIVLKVILISILLVAHFLQSLSIYNYALLAGYTQR